MKTLKIFKINVSSDLTRLLSFIISGFMIMISSEAQYFGRNKPGYSVFDYRKYFFVKHITFTFRFYNYNRFGNDAEKGSFAPLYPGYSWYIRGYDGTTNRSNYISDLTINQLQGSKMIVTNAEIRIPFTGPKRLSMRLNKFEIINLSC